MIQQLPENIRVIGTASAGTDHVDIELLRKKNIAFFSAAGCNSRAVAEYVLVSLLYFAEKSGADLSKKSIAIVGVGHVGSKVSEICSRMGMTVVEYDPPRMKRDLSFISASVDDVLKADIVTFHVPYQPDTYHYFSDSTFRNTTFDLIINAARGGIVDETFLLQELKNGHIKYAVIDCWENEPNFNSELRDMALLATPHIAGYSQQAKLKATAQLLESIFNHVNLPFSYSEDYFFNQTKHSDSKPTTFFEALNKLHNAFDFDTHLRRIVTPSETEKKRAFSNLRNALTFRNEFRFHSFPIEWIQDFPQLVHL
jgi:erythronate-4-phosphate dehydrogenase